MTSLSSLPAVQSASDATAPPSSLTGYKFTLPSNMASVDNSSDPTTPTLTPVPQPASTAATSLSRFPTMQSSSDRTAPSALPFAGYTFTLPSDSISGDQGSQATTQTSTSLLAATPRTSQVLPHESAELMDVAVSTTPDDKQLPTYATDTIQLSETGEDATQLPPSQSSQVNSTLLSRLPRELRDQIYREAVLEDDEIPISVAHRQTKEGEHRRYLQIGHPLLLVCKQTRQEVADIYYLENTFCITDDLMEERAIEELDRFLSPWAERMTKLKVSHIVRSEDTTAKINFFVSTSQGRIIIEPGAVNGQVLNFFVSLGPHAGSISTKSFSKICFCKVFELAHKHFDVDVVSWMEEYVYMYLDSQSQAGGKGYVPHCWACADRVVI